MSGHLGKWGSHRGDMPAVLARNLSPLLPIPSSHCVPAGGGERKDSSVCPICLPGISQGRQSAIPLYHLPLSHYLTVLKLLTSHQSSVTKWKSTWAQCHSCDHRCHPLLALRAGLTLQVAPGWQLFLPELPGQQCPGVELSQAGAFCQ